MPRTLHAALIRATVSLHRTFPPIAAPSCTGGLDRDNTLCSSRGDRGYAARKRHRYDIAGGVRHGWRVRGTSARGSFV